jgi:hypothetical protein
MDLRPHVYYCQTIAGLLMWGALSDERTGLFFTIAASPRQRSHFRVRFPWNSWPYFTVSDSRIPFSSPPTTCRTTVEVFDPASTSEILISLSLSYDRRSVGQSVLVSSPFLRLVTRFLLLSDHCGFLICGALSDERTGLSFTMYNVQYTFIQLSL